MRKKDKQTIIELLEKRYNGIGTALHYNSPFELLCAVIMSAQLTAVCIGPKPKTCWACAIC